MSQVALPTLLNEKRSFQEMTPPQTPPLPPSKRATPAPPQFLQERRSSGSSGSRSPPQLEEERRLSLPPIVPRSLASTPPGTACLAGRPAPEKCGVCTKEQLCDVFDVFWFLDKQRQFKLTRHTFFATIRECVSHKQVEVLRKSRLTERFRQSSQDVSLEEFLRMMWPDATDADIVKMHRWCQLRAAQTAIHGHFEGELPDTVLREIFDLLDLNGDHRVSMEELHRGQILTTAQVERFMQLAGAQYEEYQAKVIAAAALFGKKMEDYETYDGGRLGGPSFDGKLAFRDFCYAIKTGEISSR